MNFKRIFKLNYLLMWKNVKSRRAHPCHTCLEISLPLIIILLLVILALLTKKNSPPPKDTEEDGGDHFQSSGPSPITTTTSLPTSTTNSTSSTTLNSSTTPTPLPSSSFMTDETETESEGTENETDWTTARPDLEGRNDENTTDLSGFILVYSPKNSIIIDRIIEGIPQGRFGFADIKGFDNEALMDRFWAEMVLKNGGGDDLGPNPNPNPNDNNSTSENAAKMIGVVFSSGFKSSGRKKFSYIIRPSDHMKNKLMFEVYTEKNGPVGPPAQGGSPVRLPNPDDPPPPTVYETSGFLILQKYLDEGILRVIESPEGRSIDSNENETTIKDFDYTVYDKLDYSGRFKRDVLGFMPVFFQALFCIAFISVITLTITGIVNEKEAGLQEFLEMNGIPKWIQILQWFINSFIVNFFVVIIITIIVLYGFKLGEARMILLPFYTMFIAIFCYILAATAYAMLIASFFNRATIAAAIGSLLWLASFLMFWDDFQDISGYSVARQVCTAFVPNMALFQIFTIGCLKSMEIKLGKELPSTVSAWAFIGMMILSTFIFTILALYFQQIMPSDVGIPKPWHFIFTDFKCCTCKRPKVGDSAAGSNKSQKDSSKSKNKPNPKAFEPDPTDLPVGIKIQNLHKRFGKKNAVDGLTLKIYRGQITALLGHNGAGKTTTISILIGSLKSTSGKAYLDEMDIDKDMAKIRNNLGFCPQHNILFRDLKGRDQLIFYAALKGKSLKASKQKVIEFGQKTNLTAYFNKRPDQISGGQKRQLQLGIALISNPSFVILDEPTSGMDPETRRSVWGVLQDFRKDRTIILTTHHMEEADALGDRIAIMSMGQVQCVGTSNFLKKLYGDGYNLKMNIKDSGKKQEILDLVKTRFPKAKFGVANSDHELIINIPDKGNATEKLPGMFRALTEKKKELGIVEIGFTHSTIEDVFIKVGELSEGKDEDKAHQLDNIWIGGKDSPKVQNKGMLFLQRFYALLLKRAKVFSRSYGVILVMIIVPLLFIIFGFLIGDKAIKSEPPEEPLEIQPSLYKDNPWRILYKSENSPKLEGLLKSIVGESNAEAIQISLEEKFHEVQSKVGKKESQIGEFKHKYIFGVELLDEKIIKGFTSKTAIHSAPLVQNIFSNMRVKSIDPDYSIDVTSMPMDINLYHRFHSEPESKTVYKLTTGLGFAALVSLGLCLISACFIIFPGEEKVNQLKHLQIMSGISPVLYHLSNFFWDFLIVLLIFTISIIVLYCIDTGTYTSMNGPAVLLLIIVAFFLCLAVFAYLFSLCIEVPSKAFITLLQINLMTGIFLVMVLMLATMLAKKNFEDVQYYLFPMYNIGTALLFFSARSISNTRCSRVPAKDMEVMCSIKNVENAQVTRMCCENCQKLSQVEPNPQCFTMTEYDDHIYSDVIYVLILAVIFFVCLLLIEYFGTRTSKCCKKKVPLVVVAKDKKQDEDVKEEAKRVNDLATSGSFAQDQIHVIKLTKIYKEFMAVNNISFGVHKGECFGLLGVNGAGKTTTFAMLVSLIRPTSGEARSSKGSLLKNRQAYLNEIGYCPQFDPIWKILTGKELLVIFALIRGVPFKQCKLEANNWLNRFGLGDSGKIRCGKYSGGMKRRLSAAIAMIGDPSLLMLDEPTTGVDPVAKRQFWKVMGFLRKNGRSVILTSHSMDECESVCSRLAIMVNGEFQCFGNVQHIKTKFATGFEITVKCFNIDGTSAGQEFRRKSKRRSRTSSQRSRSSKGSIDEKSKSKEKRGSKGKEESNSSSKSKSTGKHHKSVEINPGKLGPGSMEFHKELMGRLKPCSLREQHNVILQYEVKAQYAWEDIFTTMEKLKTKYPKLVEDYTVSEAALEDVFLNFARHQYPPRDLKKKGCCKKRKKPKPADSQP